MKRGLGLAFAKCALVILSLSLLPAHSLASRATLADREVFARSYGFRSAAEMKTYFAVANTEIKETPVLIESLDDETKEALFKARIAPDSEEDADVLDSVGAVVINPYDIGAWVKIGKKVWKIIVDNKPIVNVSTQRVSILPQSQPNWAEMENWKGPVAKTFTITSVNKFGWKVIEQKYTVAYNYGGSLNGKGKFIANATIIPRESVNWGFTLNADVEVGDVVNTGTKENPIPGVELQLKWKADSLVKHEQGRESFFIRGDGRVAHITGM